MKATSPKTFRGHRATRKQLRNIALQEQRKVCASARRAEGAPHDIQRIASTTDLGDHAGRGGQRVPVRSMPAQRHWALNRCQGINFKAGALIMIAENSS